MHRKEKYCLADSNEISMKKRRKSNNDGNNNNNNNNSNTNININYYAYPFHIQQGCEYKVTKPTD